MTFLEHVAKDLLAKYSTDLSRITIVFPNKRASLFLSEYLARAAGMPVWSPKYMTISELFRSCCTLKVADELKLISDLHKTYTRVTSRNETLDHFFGYGKRLLSDFDDIDKSMADADKVFINVSGYHEMDDVSFLTDDQQKALRRFLNYCHEQHQSRLKERFLMLWNKLGDIYHSFKEHLREQGIAYEGMLYRDVIDRFDGISPMHLTSDAYIFVGFNLLQEVEQQLFNALVQQDKARFYWDYDHYYTDGDNEAGRYIKRYLETYGNELADEDDLYDNLSREKEITYVCAPTDDIQARYIPRWLKEKGRAAAGRHTAIVLCDETLLPTVIHCIPPDTGQVNITTGYPLSLSPVCSLIDHLMSLQLNGYAKDSGCFRLRSVRRVLNHPYARLISANSKELCRELIKGKIFNPESEMLCRDEALGEVFKPVNTVTTLLDYLINIIKTIGLSARKAGASTFTEEAVFKAYTILSRLRQLDNDGDLGIDATTLQRLIRQIETSVTVAFNGEPVVGVQVMGVLETRNLDFDHLLILSCNDSLMPGAGSDASFIPYSIRKSHRLPTSDHKAAVYAYYLHRMIQRAEDVTFVYNNSTNDSSKREMSRFMAQLMVESRHNIQRRTLFSSQQQTAIRPRLIEKDADIMTKLHAINHLSPSAINKYMRCPLQYYFNYIAKIKEPTDNDEAEIDGRVFGTIFHEAAQILYNYIGKEVTKDKIDKLIKDKGRIAHAVDQAILDELFPNSKSLKNKLNGLHLIKRGVIIEYINRLLRIDRDIAPFTMLAAEKEVSCRINISTSEGTREMTLRGIIDRLDIVTDPLTGTKIKRVLDYKTGRKDDKEDKNISCVDDIFVIEDGERKKHADYFMQSMLYAMIESDEGAEGENRLPVGSALLYIQQTGGKDDGTTTEEQRRKELLSFITVGGNPMTDITPYKQQLRQCVEDKVSEIFEPKAPFSPTPCKDICKWCPYIHICGS